MRAIRPKKLSEGEMETKLAEVFEDILGSERQATEISTENTASWDSLNHLNLILAIEEEFEITIPPEDFPALYADFATVLAYIKDKVK